MARQLKVNNTPIPYPNAGFTVSLEDISDEDTGRTLDGTMDKVIVAQKRTVQLNWSGVPDDITSSFLGLIKANTYIDFTYPDPYSGQQETKEFYTGTPTSTMLVMVNDVCYWNVSLNFIER